MDETDTTRVTVRLPDPLAEDLEETVDAIDANRSQVIREGIRRVVQGRETDVLEMDAAEDMEEYLARLESVTADVERQAARLERLPLK